MPSRAPSVDRRELRDVGRANPSETPYALAPGQRTHLGVEGVGVVEDRDLDGDPEHLHLALALRARHLVGVIEELGLGQLLESGGQVHDSTQAGGSDSGIGPAGGARAA